MKKILLSSLILLCAVCLFFSCNKNEDGKESHTTSISEDTVNESNETKKVIETSLFVTESSIETIPVTTYDIRYGVPSIKQADKEYIKMNNSVKVDSNQNDKEFLYSSISSVNSSCRYADGQGYILYYFDLTEKTEPVISINVFRNYKVSVSWNDMDYVEIATFEPIGINPREINENGSYTGEKNEKVIEINPYDYGYYNHIFILIEDTNKNDAYGPGVKNVIFDYYLCDDYLDESIRSQLKNGNIYEYHKINCATNSSNEDSEYLYFCNSGVSDYCRFADGGSEIIYLFDISDKIAFYLSMSVYQNYIIEVSANGRTWKKVIDFYDIRDQYPNGNYNKDGHLTDGSNKTIVAISPSDYGIKKDFYVRITNSNPKYGWGGTIESFEISYYQVVKQ